MVRFATCWRPLTSSKLNRAGEGAKSLLYSGFEKCPTADPMIRARFHYSERQILIERFFHRFDFGSANRHDKNIEFFELADRQLESQRLIEPPSVYATEAKHKEIVRKLGGELVSNAEDATVIIGSAIQPEDTSETWVRAARRKDNQVPQLSSTP